MMGVFLCLDWNTLEQFWNSYHLLKCIEGGLFSNVPMFHKIIQITNSSISSIVYSDYSWNIGTKAYFLRAFSASILRMVFFAQLLPCEPPQAKNA